MEAPLCVTTHPRESDPQDPDASMGNDTSLQKTKHPISPLYITAYEILTNAHDAESDDDEGWDGRLVVSPPGRIQAVWDRSNLTQPSFIDTGHVRLDLSHIANIIPL